MRPYWMLLALVAAAEAAVLHKRVDITPLPDCIKTCMRQEPSFDIVHKKAKHICGVTRSGKYEKWLVKKINPCTDKACPGDNDSPQWLSTPGITTCADISPEIAPVAAAKAMVLHKRVDISPLPDCIKDCMRQETSFDIEHKKAKHICGVTRSGRYEKWLVKKLNPCIQKVCPGNRNDPQFVAFHAWYDELCEGGHMN